MIRWLFWLFLYICFLGSLTIHVEYTDGLEIKLKGWYK